MQSSDSNSATAGLLADFLPVWDKLQELQGKYGEDEFGMKYNPLPAAMRSAFGEMGVLEFTVEVGEKVDLRRMKVIQAESSDDVKEDMVLRSLAAGLELDGNMVRKAQCVKSLGPKVAKEEAEAAAAEEEAPAAEDEEAAKE
jgi:molecular chaperone GrpE (heat shock protein)